MAVDAVWSEPLSRCISLLTGNLTAKSQTFALVPHGLTGILAQFNALSSPWQGMSVERAGNFLETSGNSNSLLQVRAAKFFSP